MQLWGLHGPRRVLCEPPSARDHALGCLPKPATEAGTRAVDETAPAVTGAASTPAVAPRTGRRTLDMKDKH